MTMAAKWIEALTGSLEQKKQYKQSLARVEALPDPYRSTAKALHRYILASGGIVDGDTMTTMFSDFADLWEQAAADRTPVREIVGENPSEFADTFVQAYSGAHWADKERARLADAIDAAVDGDETEAERS
jgi:DNA-binding ferritin-like protein (Dps family)